ncbi:conjugal transfer protein TraB [Spirochaetia bacterium]|nr:conjugal transfer protein TraB [Spirochaetia bacterium]
MSETGGTQIIIETKGRSIILVGTAHVSKESVEEVRSLIINERPSMICVELDSARYDSMSKKDLWEKLDIVKVFREGKGFLLIANLVLSSFQRRLGDNLGVKPGEEMKMAISAAGEINMPFSFCDREVQLTLARAWNKCGFISKCKLIAALLSSAFTTEKLKPEEIENLKTRNELDGMMNELASYLPEVKATLIDERDRYLAAKILENSCKEAGSKTMAVVGAGHLQGLAAHIKKMEAGEEDTNIADLETIPPKGFGGKIAGYIIPALIVAIIAAGFLRVDIDVGLQMILHWVLWNGSLAALGAILALAHPLAVLVSLVGAPIATLHPFLSVGLFSGAVEAVMRRPRVTDAETLSDDITSIKRIYKNRITHALLVFFLSSMGGAVGNFISIPNLAGILFK